MSHMLQDFPLPPIERDVLYLIDERGKTQTETGEILGLSQPSVNYRYKRAQQRKHLISLFPDVSLEEVSEVLTELKIPPKHIEAMRLFISTSSQSDVARIMETSQGAVRYWLIQSIDKLKQTTTQEDRIKRVRTACHLVFQHPNIFNISANGKREQGSVYLKTLKDAPRVRGILQVGQVVELVEGLVSNIPAKVLSPTSLRLNLESRDYQITWNE